MYRQIGLFEVPVPVNSTVDPREAPRLSKQSLGILQRLRQGPATNVELAQIGIRYSARIGELRAAGFRIDILERDRETGVNLYGLAEGSAQQASVTGGQAS